MENFAREVYESLIGERIEPVEGVEDAFTEGGVCETYYAQMRAAYANQASLMLAFLEPHQRHSFHSATFPNGEGMDLCIYFSPLVMRWKRAMIRTTKQEQICAVYQSGADRCPESLFSCTVCGAALTA